MKVFKETFWLFLDDVRDPPNDGRNWQVFRKVGDLLEFILTHPNQIAGISFDHDMGDGNATGKDALDVIHALIYMREWFPAKKPVLTVHSANSVRVPVMEKIIGNIYNLFDT